MFGRRWGIAVALAGALALSGCAGEPEGAEPRPESTPSADAGSDVYFESDEVAKDAALAAYIEYLAVVDLVGNEGGQNPERLERYASGSVLESDLLGFEQAREAQARSTGSTKVSGARFQSMEETSAGTEVRLYLCEDISKVDVVDASGKSIVSPDRPNVLTYLVAVTFQSLGERKVTSREMWNGPLECN